MWSRCVQVMGAVQEGVTRALFTNAKEVGGRGCYTAAPEVSVPKAAGGGAVPFGHTTATPAPAAPLIRSWVSHQLSGTLVEASPSGPAVMAEMTAVVS